MNTTCPGCGSATTSPSFAFEWVHDESGGVTLTDPHYSCADCRNTWEVKGVLHVVRPSSLSKTEAVERFVDEVKATAGRQLPQAREAN